MASDFNKSGDPSNPFVAVRDQLERSLETAEEDRFDAVRQGLIKAVQGIRPKDWEKPGRLSSPVVAPKEWVLQLMLASGSHDGEIRLWNPASGEHLRTLSAITYSVAFSPGVLQEEGHRSLHKLRAEMSEAGFSLERQGHLLTVHWNGNKA